ncbi:MAG: aldo/keto reductase [Chloroflexi bacterium]|uniref:Aldo/keto reductase n=1 Tax=Candidatus Chlorohelix allophototropha TaxID=3003348 RepID=A0A8T7M6E2_9CHLR|nr:aldo/keto reductase [Chloroflexota bacterium]WJW69951.1 aldo/keto reductase [Chloroflexota bacterium L227-S17]
MRKLGRTGLKVAPICLGGNVFGWTIDEATSFKVLDTYVEEGGNFIDTADVYSAWVPGNSGGESEVILGNWMKAHNNRDKLIIATKVGNPMGKDPNRRGLSRRRIIEAVEESLKRLQTDYIDLYQSHIDDTDTPLNESLRAYDDLVTQGKVRYLGASNYSSWRLTRALWESDKHEYARYDCLQPVYHLMNRAEFERELEPLCLDQQVGVINYSSLASGFLTGKYRLGKDLPKTPRAVNIQARYMNEKGFALLEKMDKIAESHNATLAQIALAWLLARPVITAPIASATTVEQTRELMGAVSIKLEKEDLAELNAASAWK